MMEFKARLLVDSQDPELAYALLRDALVRTGVAPNFEVRLSDSWMRNNEPLPAASAQKIALAWQRSNQSGSSDRVVFQTNDPAVMAELNQMDMFADPVDIRNLAYLRAGDDLEIEGHVGLVPIIGEGK